MADRLTKHEYKLTLTADGEPIQRFDLSWLISDDGDEFWFSGLDGIDLVQAIAAEINRKERRM